MRRTIIGIARRGRRSRRLSRAPAMRLRANPARYPSHVSCEAAVLEAGPSRLQAGGEAANVRGKAATGAKSDTSHVPNTKQDRRLTTPVSVRHASQEAGVGSVGDFVFESAPLAESITEAAQLGVESNGSFY